MEFDLAIQELWSAMGEEESKFPLAEILLKNKDGYSSRNHLDTCDRYWGNRHSSNEFEIESSHSSFFFKAVNSWEDYCRGCHMGTLSDYFHVPIEVINKSIEVDQQEGYSVVTLDHIKKYVAERYEYYKKKALSLEIKQSEEKLQKEAAAASRRRKDYERLRAEFETS